MRILVIVESPFANSDPIEMKKNLDYARAALHDCLMRGESPFASHLLYTQSGVLDGGLEHEREMGMEAGYDWMEAADLIAVYCDRGISNGMKTGIERASAQDRDLKIEFRSLEGTEVQRGISSQSKEEELSEIERAIRDN